jgi:hypothetical protein
MACPRLLLLLPLFLLPVGIWILVGEAAPTGNSYSSSGQGLAVSGIFQGRRLAMDNDLVSPNQHTQSNKQVAA